jgi:ElaB/YqjD/DUF883 family membrane-anchored ribosome-binding protein
MAQGKDQLDDRSHGGSEQVRANIDVTRQAMDRTIEAIEGKLTPGQLLMEGLSLLGKGGATGANKIVELAREHPVPAAVIGVGVGMMIRDASNRKGDGGRVRTAGYASGYGYEGGFPGVTPRTYGDGPGVASRTAQDAKERVAEAAQSARETVSQTVHDARDTVAGAAHSAKETVAEATHAAREKVSDVAETAREIASSVAETAREKASAVAESARETLETVEERAALLRERAHVRVKDAKIGFWQTLDEQPLVVGAAAIAIGLVAGLLIPGTSRESEMLGEKRDEVLRRAQEKGREVLEKGKHVAQAAVETFKTEAEQQGLTPAAIAEKVRTVGRDTVEQVRQEAQKEGLVPNSQS